MRPWPRSGAGASKQAFQVSLERGSACANREVACLTISHGQIKSAIRASRFAGDLITITQTESSDKCCMYSPDDPPQLLTSENLLLCRSKPRAQAYAVIRPLDRFLRRADSHTSDRSEFSSCRCDGTRSSCKNSADTNNLSGQTQARLNQFACLSAVTSSQIFNSICMRELLCAISVFLSSGLPS